MNTAIKALALLTLLLVNGCATRDWHSPYPPVPQTTRPEDKKYYQDGDFRCDAVEKNSNYKEVFAVIDDETDQAVKDHPYNGEFGFYHTWADTKRRILYWKYGIDWHDVQAMTPGLIID